MERLADLLPDGTRTTLRTDGTLAVLSTPTARQGSRRVLR
jgi:hypothetical protein